MEKAILILVLLASNISTSQEISKEQLDEYLKIETIGGKLDFELNMKADERPFYLYDRVMYNRKDFGIFLWGAAVKKLGINSHKKAIELWEEIKERKLSKPEKKALIKGYKTK